MKYAQTNNDKETKVTQPRYANQVPKLSEKEEREILKDINLEYAKGDLNYLIDLRAGKKAGFIRGLLIGFFVGVIYGLLLGSLFGR